MADLKTNTVNAWESTLSSALASGATTINVTDTTGSPAVPFYVVLDPGNDSKREVVLVDSAKTATTFTLTAATKRGQDGTSDVAHDSGAVVAIVPIAALFNDLHDRVDTKATDADVVKLTGAQTIAGAKTFSTDPILADGSSALSQTEGNAAYRPLAAAGARAYLTVDQSLTTATYTSLLFDVESYDTDGFHDNATNPSRFTIPAGKGGKYLLIGVVSFAANATGLRIGRWLLNGGARAYSSISPFTGANNRLIVTSVENLVAGDYVELQGYQSSGGALNAVSSYPESWAAVAYLGA